MVGMLGVTRCHKLTIETHRGIKTTTEPKNETEPLTKINRFGQKTMSLPRIDDQKRLAGYPGITGISRKLANCLPSCITYVEPFAGMAKTFQMMSISKACRWVLNDKSTYVYNWLKKEMPNYVTVTNEDFIDCMKKWDSEKTLHVIDMPWFKGFYDQPFSYFDRPDVKTYDEQVLDICKVLKGKFVITSRKENKRMLYAPYNHCLITSQYVVCGKYPKVLITTNLDVSGWK